MKLGFFTTLTIIFIVLKITEVIAWSWFLVLSPLLIGFVPYLIIVILSAVSLVFDKNIK